MISYTVEKLDGKAWRESDLMHLSYEKAFNLGRSKDVERPDFVLIAKQNGQQCGFVTCIEMDGETLYWQLGGAFDEIKKSAAVINTFLSLIGAAGQEGYKRITMRIENTNLPMLRIALKCGFLIVGTWNFKGKVFLELLNEFGGQDVI